MPALDICGDYGPLDFQNSCIRDTWAAVLPAAFVFCLCLTSIPLPGAAARLISTLGSPLKPFLTLEEAASLLDTNYGAGALDDGPCLRNKRHSVVFVLLGILQSLFWTLYGAYSVSREQLSWHSFLPFLVATGWVYTTVRPIARPPVTVPFDMYILYLLFLATSVLQIGGYIYEYGVLGTADPSIALLVVHVANLLCITFLVLVVLNMPLGIRSTKVNEVDFVRHSTIWLPSFL